MAIKHKETKSFEPTVLLSDIKILTMNEITEIFGINEERIQLELEKPNNSFNFWYPAIESNFTIEEVLNTIYLFRQKFLDSEIICKHIMQTEIFMNTLDKHIFAYSIVQHFNPVV